MLLFIIIFVKNKEREHVGNHHTELKNNSQ